MRDWQKISAVTLWTAAAVGLAGAALADNGGFGMGGMGGMGGAGMTAMFDTFDADKDGKVTQAEIDAYRAAGVAEVDGDKDGLLSADELAQMHLKAMTERANTMAARMLEMLDSDGDAKLSAAEMAAGPGPAMMLDRLDTDGDGAISTAEMQAAQAMMGQRGMGKDGMGMDGQEMGGHGKGHGMGEQGHRGGGFWGTFGGDDN